MTFDTTAYYGQPSTMLPQFTPPGLFGGFPGPYGLLAEQLLAAHLGLLPFAAALGRGRLAPPMEGLTGQIPWAQGLQAQYGAPFGQTIGGWAQPQHLQPQHLQLQPQLCGVGAQGLWGQQIPGAIGGLFGPQVNPFQQNPFQANPFQ